MREQQRWYLQSGLRGHDSTEPTVPEDPVVIGEAAHTKYASRLQQYPRHREPGISSGKAHDLSPSSSGGAWTLALLHLTIPDASKAPMTPFPPHPPSALAVAELPTTQASLDPVEVPTILMPLAVTLATMATLTTARHQRFWRQSSKGISDTSGRGGGGWKVNFQI